MSAGERFEAGLARVAVGFEASLASCEDEPSLRAAAAKLIGPSGELTLLLKMMPELPGDRRKALGQRANELKRAVQGALDQRLVGLARAARQADLEGPPIDPSLPGRGLRRGALHPITRTIHELLDAFQAIGFEVVDAPEVELAEYNFSRLGFPPDHPATDMQDSFFVQREPGGTSTRFDDQLLLRTHTSNAQVHVMTERHEYPICCVSAGSVYRRDDDATHSPMFHQIEGFWIDRGITMAHLLGVLTTFAKRMFGKDVPVRLRPSYFPFVGRGAARDIG
jgi:phenylalanyl-tRNA synthetase alpha chain